MPKAYTQNILRVYDQSSHEEIMAGINWYSLARQQCQQLADTYGLPLDTVVCVVAALSPNNRWTRNIRDAELLIQTYQSGLPIDNAKVCTYRAMRQKAWNILASTGNQLSDRPRVVDRSSTPRVLAKLKGQKITNFAECILGEDTCVIDGHAYNIAHGKRLGLTDGSITLGKRLYGELQHRYRRAASLRGLLTFEMQAITWTTWRRIHNIA